MASYIPYCEDLYNFSQVCFFTDKNAWDPSNLMRPGLLGVSFGLAFEARDAHLQTITTLPALCNALTMVAVVDSSLLTDAGINDLVTNCPNLKFLSFSGAGKLTNASFYVALTKLLKLELLRITGRSPFKSVSHSGKLKTKGSITLLRKRESDPSKDIARDLKKLDLTGQDGMSLAACRKLSGEREGLEVVVGSTGASVYTYWKGEIVKVESNPGFRRYMGGPESGIEEESESDDDGEEEEYSDPEDETYDAMLSDLWSGGVLGS
ncbi:hypothetical protein FPQ18DRAFT_392727 [Pyronema domesticum]|nr:hypothetical protein FPQ18DRAFT_392727 [Pyronema domesticum]